ncbi:hypothetical protein [Candidatus Thiodiazotropha sp. CDECU1]|nr:hypothetical protein [Candidatus Thiodiazotropha sp. CDECU1]
MSDMSEKLPGTGFFIVFLMLPLSASAYDLSDIFGGDAKYSF